jgi:hypothetical protein
MSIIWSFIEKQEGKAINNAYVPQKDGEVIGNSGTTIATGVDLGQMNQNDLDNLNLDNDLETKLIPYLGLKKDDAVNFLQNNPLTLSDEEVSQLDQKIREKFTNDVADLYNNSSNNTFDSLTDTQQTVILSVTYQYGITIPHRCPKFWKYATEGCWPCVVNVLRNFGDTYSNRRNLEADLLENNP